MTGTRAFSLSAVFATTLLGLTLLINGPHGAALPGGFHSSVLAFCFARESADLLFLQGAGAAETLNRAAMYRGLQLDMLFPFAYAAVLVATLRSFREASGRWASLGLLSACLIVPADHLENWVMFNMLDTLSTGPVDSAQLNKLVIWGGLKWLLIAISIFVIGRYQWRAGDEKGGLFSLLTVLLVVCSLLTNGDAIFAESMYLLISAFVLRACVLLLTARS